MICLSCEEIVSNAYEYTASFSHLRLQLCSNLCCETGYFAPCTQYFWNYYMLRIMGGSRGGPDPPPPWGGPRYRLLNIGPKVGPPPGTPFFACRPKIPPTPTPHFSKILDPPQHMKWRFTPVAQYYIEGCVTLKIILIISMGWARNP